MAPFVSKSQQKWMFANKPKMAKEWARHTDFTKLPVKAQQLSVIKKRLNNSKA